MGRNRNQQTAFIKMEIPHTAGPGGNYIPPTFSTPPPYIAVGSVQYDEEGSTNGQEFANDPEDLYGAAFAPSSPSAQGTDLTISGTQRSIDQQLEKYNMLVPGQRENQHQGPTDIVDSSKSSQEGP